MSLTDELGAGGFAPGFAKLARIPAWSLGPVLVAFAGGAVATVFYVWTPDLTPLIAAHSLGDLIGLVLLPPVS